LHDRAGFEDRLRRTHIRCHSASSCRRDDVRASLCARSEVDARAPLCDRRAMTRLAYAAAAVLVLGLWLPWATLSVGLFGGEPRPIGEVNGEQIGSGLLDVPVGWIAAAAGVVGALAVARRRGEVATAAAVVALGVTGYTFVAVPGDETATANGENVTQLLNAQVGYAWGLFAVTAAAIALLVAARRVSRGLDEEPVAAPAEP
jgi:hypothetical protein